MAIQNVRMQQKRGEEVNFDPDKILPGEFALSTDQKIIRIGISPGVCIRLATYDAFETDMAKIQSILAETKTIQSAIQRIQSEVNAKAQLTIENANSAQESADRAYEEAERAKMYANNASAVTGVNIATKTVPGLMAGGDNAVSEDGTLMLTKTTTDRTLLKSHAGGLKVNSIAGESQQNQYSGKNKLEVKTASLNNNGIAFTNNGDGTVTVNGTNTAVEALFNFYQANSIPTTLEKGVEYIASVNSTGNVNMQVYQYLDGGWKHLVTTKTSGAFTIDENATGLILRLQVSGEGTTVSNVKCYPMIRLASITDSTYEPYVGGTASPNPDYQQDIESVEVGEIWTCGKNLLKVDVGGRTIYGVEWLVDNNNGVIKANGTATHNSLLNTIVPGIVCDGKPIVISTVGGDSNIQTEFKYINIADEQKTVYFGTHTEKTMYDVKLVRAITYYVPTGNTVNNISFTPMIRFADTDGTYEPYTEKKITLSNPITLRGIGDVKDTIIKQNGVYGELSKQGYALFDGSADEAWVDAKAIVGNKTHYRYKITLKNANVTQARSACLCNRAIYSATSYEVGYCFIYGSQFFIHTIHETLEDFKTWLASNNVTVVYPLETPTFEPLPTADQIALHQLETFGTVTYLSTDSEIEPVIEVEYGTSKVGAYALKGMQTAEANKLRYEQLNTLVGAMATQQVTGSEV